MKKLIFCTATFFACVAGATYVWGQDETSSSGFYGQLNVEYGVGMNLDNLGEEQYTNLDPIAGVPNGYSPINNGSYTKPILGTVGSGFTATLTPGYMFNEHIAVELGLSYFISSETTTEDRTWSVATFAKRKTTTQSNQFRVFPSLVLSTGSSNPLYGFAKVGVMIPAGGTTKFNVDARSPRWADGTPIGSPPGDASLGMTADEIKAEGESSGKFSLGFRGSVGAGYAISDNLVLSLEVFYTALAIKSKERVVKSYKVNGNEMVGTNAMPLIQTQTNYVDEVNSTTNNPKYNTNVDNSKPLEDIGTRGNYSQVGLSIGIRYRF